MAKKLFLIVTFILISSFESFALFEKKSNKEVSEYLVAKISKDQNDFSTSKYFFKKVHKKNISNITVLNGLLLINIVEEDLKDANKISQEILLKCIDNLILDCKNNIDFQARLVSAIYKLKDNKLKDASKEFELIPLSSDYGYSNYLDQIYFKKILKAWTWADKENYKKSIKIIDSIDSNNYQYLTILHKALIYDLVDELDLAEIFYDQALALKQETYVINLYFNFLDRNNKVKKKKLLTNQYLSYFDDRFLKIFIKAKNYRIINNQIDGIAISLFNTNEPLKNLNEDQILIILSLASNLSTNFHESSFILADYLASYEQYEKAIQIYNKIPKDHYLSEISVLRISNLLFLEENNLSAIKYLTSHLTISESYEGLIRLGSYYRYESNWDEAIKTYNEAIKLKKDIQDISLWEAYYYLGISYERNKEWHTAEDFFFKSLNILEDAPEVLNYLAYSYLEMNENFPEAKLMLEKALSQRPDDSYIIDSMGWYYFKVGEYNKALPLFEYAITIDPSDPTINDHYGDVLWKTGNHMQARYQWQKSLNLEPEKEQALIINKKLLIGI